MEGVLVTANDHLVRVMVKLSDEHSGDHDEIERLLDIEPQIELLVEQNGLGELDGNEIGEGYFTWFIYGPDADRIFSSLLPTLLNIPMPPGSHLIVRRGAPGALEQTIPLNLTQNSVS
jgi:hypothetical protein